MEEIKYKLPYYAMDLQFFAGGGEKTEEATSKHLKDAREEGQVAKSQELITAVMLFSLFISFKAFGGYIANNIIKAFYKAFGYISIYALDTPNIGNANAMIRQGMLDIFFNSNSCVCVCNCSGNCFECITSKVECNNKTIKA